MHEFSCYLFFVAYDSCLSIYSFDEYSFIGCMQMELISLICYHRTLIGDEVSYSRPVYDLANCIVVNSIVESEFSIVFLFFFSFGDSHLFAILLLV